MTKEQGQRLYSRLAAEVIMIGPMDDDEPELAAAWHALHHGDEAVATAAERIIFVYRIAGGNRGALAAEWALVKAFGER
jgi:hypothetical protein